MLRALSVVAMCLLLAATVQAADEPNWQEDWVGVQAAAVKSGRPILAYIYQHNQPACIQMEQTTFLDPQVIAALSKGYELFAANATSSRFRPFLNKYGVGVRSNQGSVGEVDTSLTPGYLFLTSTGKEYFRAFGFLPAAAFLELLSQVGDLMKATDELGKKPEDAMLNARAGHLYALLERPGLARPLLNKALQLDPENATGARAEAQLDLTILGIPEDPQTAYRALMRYRFDYPQTKRGQEVQYYMAVAQLAMQHYAEAEKLLLDMQSVPPLLPDGKTPNPEYRNVWSERADLLLGQLRDMLKNPAGANQ